MKIDVNFDFTTDTPNYWGNYCYDNLLGRSDKPCKDPDSCSQTMKQYHQILWSKPLPNGENMNLEFGKGRDYLNWKSFRFGADSICASFRYKKLCHILEQVNDFIPNYHEFMENFIRKTYTIGGSIIFPKDNSINGARGCNAHIKDRWDLTLECIRRYYKGEDSPLFETLAKNKEFFNHKKMPPNSPTPDQRAEMLALSAGKGMQVCDIELRRGGASFTFETVEALAKQYPDDELVLFMGTDMFLSFSTWKEPQQILAKASLGVFYRGDAKEIEQIAEQKEKMQQQGARVYLVENPVTAISSTQLRRLLVFRCAGDFLQPGVESYIRERGLYGVNEDCRNLSLDGLEQAVVSLLKPNRVAHVLGCRDTAVALAKRWGADVTDAARAGLLHDITKALDGPLQLTLCHEYGMVPGEFSKENPKTLHALTGSLVAEQIFGEKREVVDAIACHTTGKANMTTLEKILYVADYMEPNRNFPGVEELRALAYTDLDKALKLGLTMTLELLKEKKQDISPASAEALAFLQKAGV